MSLKAPENGLFARMRTWMSTQEKPFTCADVSTALELSPGKERLQVCSAMMDFLQRGEVTFVKTGKNQNSRRPVAVYRFNRAWKRKKRGVLNKKIIKAIYVAGIFTTADIIRLAEAPTRAHVEKTIRQLVRSGMVAKVGRRRCNTGTGPENLYNIPNRDRYRLEVME